MRRVNCMAHLIIVLKPNGKFMVDRFESTHNHNYTPNKAFMFRSQRGINDVQAAKTSLVESVGITPKVTFDSMTKQAGGMNNVGFLQMDYKNYLLRK